ncbi:hypothetical protein H2201_008992, partial [Coniosporium apollinis]
ETTSDLFRFSPKSFTAQRQEAITKLATSIEAWLKRVNNNGMVIRPSLTLGDTTLQHYNFSNATNNTFSKASSSKPDAIFNNSSSTSFSSLKISIEENPSSPLSDASTVSDSGLKTPLSDTIAPREAEILAKLRKPDRALVAMGHSTLRYLLKDAREKLEETSQLAAGEPCATPDEPDAPSQADALSKDVETSLQELLGLLDQFDKTLRTWVDVINGGTGVEGRGSSSGSVKQEEGQEGRSEMGGPNPTPAGVREPRAELVSFKWEREQLRQGKRERAYGHTQPREIESEVRKLHEVAEQAPCSQSQN